jgi:hypothetical protein
MEENDGYNEHRDGNGGYDMFNGIRWRREGYDSDMDE